MADDKDKKADDVEVTLDEGSEDEAGQKGKKKLNKKKLIIVIAAAVLLLGGGGGAAAFFLLSGGGHEEEKVELQPAEYITLETVTVDLMSRSRRPSYIKLTITVEISGSYKKQLEEKTPVILDAMKSHLRGNTKEDLSGQVGTETLRAELMRVIGGIMGSAKINRILFKDIFVQ